MKSDAGSLLKATTRRIRVLAVDDDGLILMNTVAMLEDMGHEVIEARSAEIALALSRRSNPFDILVTDQAMDGMLGLELARELSEDRPDLAVILATGYGNHIEALPKGVVVLAKPFDHGSLAAAITEALTLAA